MQSGGGAGRSPSGPPPPPGRSPSSASASPSSSSSASHLGLESIHHHHQHQQQQLALRQQQQQQQQLRNSEGEEKLLPYKAVGIHGVMGGSSFPSSSSAVSTSQPLSKLNDLHHRHGAHPRDENPNKGQGLEQHLPNPVHQAYLQFALQNATQQQKSHGNLPVQQQGRFSVVGPPGRGQDIRVNNLKMQDLMSLQAANQAHASMLKKSEEHFEKQTDQGHTSGDQRNDLRPPQAGVIGQLTTPTNVSRPVQSAQSQASMENLANNQLLMAQLKAMQAWAMEHNVDLSLPANANLIAQVLPIWQSSRLAAMQKPNEASTARQLPGFPPSKQQVMSSPVRSETSAHGNSLSDQSGRAGAVKGRQTLPSGPIASGGANTPANSNNIQMQQQLAVQSRESQNERVSRPPIAMGNRGAGIHPPQSSGGSSSQSIDHTDAKNKFSGAETPQMHYFKQMQQLNCPPSQSSAAPSREVGGTQIPSQSAQVPHQRIGFTKQQLFVLKAQILAFRRLKRGEGTLPQEVLQAIAPPALDSQPQQIFTSPGKVNQERMVVTNAEEHARHSEVNEKDPQLAPSSKGHVLLKEEPFTGEEKAPMVSHLQGATGPTNVPVQATSAGKLEQSTSVSVKSEQDVERVSQMIPINGDFNPDKGKAIPTNNATVDSGQVKKPASTSGAPPPKDAVTTRKYHGPLFDFPFFTRRPEALGSTTTVSNHSNLTLAYDVKDLLFEEGMEVLTKKRTENLKKISGLLAVNLERKRIRPDLVLRLQIEEKKLRLLDLQARLRDEVDQEQQEIMAMSDRPYRKFVKQCERQRIELIRQVQQLQKVTREKQLKSIFQWRKKLLEAHWAIRDARTARNRGVAKYHERMLREFSKRKDEDRTKRMEALKNNDVDRYREMLLEQQTNIPGDAAQRYNVLASFLSQTEEYLHKLGGKITAAKNNQEVEEAANVAAAAARSQGLSEEEVKSAAACAGEEVLIRNRFSEMNAPKDSSSVNKYYNLAHAVNERVIRQPSMLRAGTLRDYQLVGLQWMLSLYNNKLNGILADEMGLGKTVQVMALIAYLMEFKGNYGPHLIIVPNAVLVNWKSELHNWLPSITCIFYVGAKEQRLRLFSHEVRSMKFNVLVTTYEFVMYDRSKLSKINWKYIIIDEAQRMKDRESVLARDLDRYHCQRRLLLTGTPLQNDLKELWSLLNLLLPEVFDNRKAFHDWFSKPFQKDGPSHNEEDDWLETEKKVIIIHRLHQILEPFMLRRRVEDVEGSLPRKVSIVLRCRMSAIQGSIYDWIKSTGTIRVDPEDELRKVEKNPMYQVRMYKNLNNKCMELRKACNHPLLNYPYFSDYSKDFVVRSCGKLWILDRVLIKLQRSGHRVLLFSTMTKLLDILEEYLQWRGLVYRRIDGTTSLEDRESAIVDFNSPDSACFIFLLSIRAAGRGLNLQSADTVVIYDPDPNPQNEEQAVARAHRIGQKREVKVIYMEAVVDKFSSYQKEDELRNGGGMGDIEDDLAGKDRYIGSIESLIRNNIQQYKIDMADEVINAGRFDQRTTHEERRMTLETLLHDDERYQETVHDVPSLHDVNRMIARSEEEVELFDQMDEEFDWTGDMMKHNQVPKWLRAGSKELNAVVTNLSKKPSKNILASSIDLGSSEFFSGLSPSTTEGRRVRPKRPSTAKNYSIYRELDDEDGEYSDASSEERNAYSLHEEEGEIGEFEDEEFNGAVDVQPSNKDQSEEEGLVCDGGGYEFSQVMEGMRIDEISEEAGSSGSSSGSRRWPQPATPSMSSQKFGSLSALDARPKTMSDELEEGEIAVSGDSHMDLQPSVSWNHERDDGEDEQVLQPAIKRKRSARTRPRYTLEKLEGKSSNERVFSPHGSQLPLQVDHEHGMQSRNGPEIEAFREPFSDRHDIKFSSSKQKRNLPSRKSSQIKIQKSDKLSCMSASSEDAIENSRESWNSKTMMGVPNFSGTKMSDSLQRKCKNVISKLLRRIDKDGYQIVPFLYDLWKRNENSSFVSTVAMASNLFDLRRIDQRVDNLEYSGVKDFIEDMQLMLKNAVKHCSYSHEVRCEARKLHDLFFDIMKIAFPDTDFREARNGFALPSPGGAAAAPSPKLGASTSTASASQSKRQKAVGEVEPDPGPTKAVPRGTVPPEESGRTRTHVSKVQKESRPGREQALPECSPPPLLPSLLKHPGDLVICKKKRKDRDKSAVKQRAGPASPPNPAWVGPLSPPSSGRAGPVSPAGTGRGAPRVAPQRGESHPAHTVGWLHQPPAQVGSGGGPSRPPGVGEVQWAKPVKRVRTDAGKRRPSHL